MEICKTFKRAISTLILILALFVSSQIWATTVGCNTSVVGTGLILSPVGDYSTQFTTVVVPTAGMSHYFAVWDQAQDGDTTYIEDSTLNDVDSFSFFANQIPAGATINSVTACSYAKYINFYNVFADILQVDGVAYEGSYHALTTSYVQYSYQWTTNPAGGNWTVDDINGVATHHPLQAFGVKNLYATGILRVTQDYLVIDYTPIAGPTRVTDLNDNFEIDTVGYEKGANALCTASATPWACCTGSGTGTCLWTEVPTSGTITHAYALPADANGNKPLYGGKQCVKTDSGTSTVNEPYIVIDHGSDIGQGAGASGTPAYSEVYVKFDSGKLTLAADTNTANTFEGRGTSSSGGLSSKINVYRASGSYYWSFNWISAGVVQCPGAACSSCSGTQCYYNAETVAENTWYILQMRYDGINTGKSGVKIDRCTNVNCTTTVSVANVEYQLSGTVRTGTRYWRLGSQNNVTKTVVALFDRFQVDTNTYVGNTTEILGDIDGMTATRPQIKIIKSNTSDNNTILTTINQGNLGSGTVYKSTDNGATWDIEFRPSTDPEFACAIVQDTFASHNSGHNLYVVCGETAPDTGAGAAKTVTTYKGTWVSGTTWTWAAYGTVATGDSSNGWTCPTIAIDSPGVLWVAVRHFAATGGYYEPVVYYDAGGGSWAISDNFLYQATTNEQMYPKLIAYGTAGTGYKMGLAVQSTGTGKIYWFWRNDVDSKVSWYTYDSDGKFADAEWVVGGLTYSHIDADVDSSGNVWLGYQDDTGRGPTTLSYSLSRAAGTNRTVNHFYLCYRKYVDSTSTWSDEEWVTDTTVLGGGYISVSIPTNQRVFSTYNNQRALSNSIYLIERTGGTTTAPPNGAWSIEGSYTGAFVRRAWQAKQDKTAIGNGDYRIWQEAWNTIYQVKFAKFIQENIQLSNIGTEIVGQVANLSETLSGVSTITGSGINNMYPSLSFQSLASCACDPGQYTCSCDVTDSASSIVSSSGSNNIYSSLSLNSLNSISSSYNAFIYNYALTLAAQGSHLVSYTLIGGLINYICNCDAALSSLAVLTNNNTIDRNLSLALSSSSGVTPAGCLAAINLSTILSSLSSLTSTSTMNMLPALSLASIGSLTSTYGSGTIFNYLLTLSLLGTLTNSQHLDAYPSLSFNTATLLTDLNSLDISRPMTMSSLSSLVSAYGAGFVYDYLLTLNTLSSMTGSHTLVMSPSLNLTSQGGVTTSSLMNMVSLLSLSSQALVNSFWGTLPIDLSITLSASSAFTTINSAIQEGILILSSQGDFNTAQQLDTYGDLILQGIIQSTVMSNQVFSNLPLIMSAIADAVFYRDLDMLKSLLGTIVPGRDFRGPVKPRKFDTTVRPK